MFTSISVLIASRIELNLTSYSVQTCSNIYATSTADLCKEDVQLKTLTNDEKST